jgi:hypothetical protein
MAGARLGFGTMLVPFVAAHAGYGWLSQGYTIARASETYHDGGFTMDAKVGFDLRPIELVSVGVNVGYNLLSSSALATAGAGSSLRTYGVGGAINFLSFGLQAALTF